MDTLLNTLRETVELLPPWAARLTGVILLALLAVVADLVAKRQLVLIVRGISRRSKHTWDDALVQHGVFGRFAQILPALIFYFGLRLVPGLRDGVVVVGENLALSYGLLMLSLAASALLSSVNAIYEQYPVATERPIKGFLQVAKIGMFVFTGVLIVATLTERSPVLLLSGLGAMTAVLLLVFKDTILSLVASVQLTSLDMVRVGDWIEMPQCNADGDVIDVSLHTVKIQNWDKTITTIPTYALISESFKNWRGMSESGGRRIKRSVSIDMSSVKFCDSEMLERFAKIQYIAVYIEETKNLVEQFNREMSIDMENLVNGRRMTNIGTFRAYVQAYLQNHPAIDKDMTFLVRQLPPSENGLPIEIYVFSKDQVWANYEAIQADIFDHILAVIPEFDLRVYQNPTGADFQGLKRAT